MQLGVRGTAFAVSALVANGRFFLLWRVGGVTGYSDNPEKPPSQAVALLLHLDSPRQVFSARILFVDWNTAEPSEFSESGSGTRDLGSQDIPVLLMKAPIPLPP
jgi:hypothetical protein